MPVILTEPEEVETWMTAPRPQAGSLQRSLSDGALTIVARGEKADPLPDARNLKPGDEPELPQQANLF